MKFSESEHQWQDPIPEWVTYLIQFGYAFAEKAECGCISLISMPCDSPGAGLIALGAMRHYLSAPPLSDKAIHDLLESHRDFESMKDSSLFCGNDMCKYIGEDNGKAVIEEIIIPDNRRNRKNPRKPKIITAALSTHDLRFEKEPLLISTRKALPYLGFYNNIIPADLPIYGRNLQQSHSGVCLAGKRRGFSLTKDLLLDTSFEEGGIRVSLHDLLSLVDGSLDVVSRVTTYNTRTDKMEWLRLPPKIVVTDGIDAFLKIMDEMQRTAINDFSKCNIVAVVDLTEKREKLNSLQVKIAELKDFYDSVSLAVDAPPRGMAMAIYKRR